MARPSVLRLAADENFNNNIVRGLLRRKPDADFVRVQDVARPTATPRSQSECGDVLTNSMRLSRQQSADSRGMFRLGTEHSEGDHRESEPRTPRTLTARNASAPRLRTAERTSPGGVRWRVARGAGRAVTSENHWRLAADPMNLRIIIDLINHRRPGSRARSRSPVAHRALLQMRPTAHAVVNPIQVALGR